MLRVAIRFKGLNRPKRFRLSNDFRARILDEYFEPAPIFLSGSCLEDKTISARGTIGGGEKLASQTQSWDDKWKEISRRVGGRLFLFVPRTFLPSFLVFPSLNELFIKHPLRLDFLFLLLKFEIRERKLIPSTTVFRFKSITLEID